MPDPDACDGVKEIASRPCEHYPADSGRSCLQDRARALDPESDCSLAFRSEAADEAYPCFTCQARLAVAGVFESESLDDRLPQSSAAYGDPGNWWLP
jgi:hypothetical protein